MADLISLAKRSYIEELRTARVYEELAEGVSDKALSRRLRAMAEMERRHAEFWRRFLERRGEVVTGGGIFTLGWHMKVSIARLLLGKALFMKFLEMAERDDAISYSKMMDSGDLSDEERRELKRIIEDELVHEGELLEAEGRFRDFIDHIRDAVLGMNDGLVEILSASMGLAGAYASPMLVAVGGSVVGIAGALSMAIGAYVSVKAQRDVRLSLSERISMAIRLVPSVFLRRLRWRFSRQFGEEGAKAVTDRLAEDKELLKENVLRNIYEVGELSDPLRSALYTGLFYLLGAFIPLFPYFTGISIKFAIPISMLSAAAMLSVSATIISILGSLRIGRKVAEMVGLGLTAALATFAIGRLASAILGLSIT